MQGSPAVTTLEPGAGSRPDLMQMQVNGQARHSGHDQ